MSELENVVLRVAQLPRPGPIPKGVYEYRQEALAALRPGDIRLETLLTSVDAGARAMIDPDAPYPIKLRVGNRVPASAVVGRVVETQAEAFREGDYVRAFMVTRQKYLTLHPTRDPSVKKIDPSDGPLHMHLGAVGLTGFTAWLGIFEIGRPRPGETVLVSAAAGAVGSIAGQIARLAGARVIGIAGGEEKCRLVVEQFGFDDCVDYKADDFRDALMRACSEGVDVYFENVGGAVQRAALSAMNEFGRVILCGQVAQYGGDAETKDGVDLMLAVNRRLTMQGYLSSDHMTKYPAFEALTLKMIRSGRLKSRATITSGFEALHDAVNSLTSGKNIGQQVHQMAE